MAPPSPRNQTSGPAAPALRAPAQKAGLQRHAQEIHRMDAANYANRWSHRGFPPLSCAPPRPAPPTCGAGLGADEAVAAGHVGPDVACGQAGKWQAELRHSWTHAGNQRRGWTTHPSPAGSAPGCSSTLVTPSPARSMLRDLLTAAAAASSSSARAVSLGACIHTQQQTCALHACPSHSLMFKAALLARYAYVPPLPLSSTEPILLVMLAMRLPPPPPPFLLPSSPALRSCCVTSSGPAAQMQLVGRYKPAMRPPPAAPIPCHGNHPALPMAFVVKRRSISSAVTSDSEPHDATPALLISRST